MQFRPQTLRTRRIRSTETTIDAFIRHKAEIDRALERPYKRISPILMLPPSLVSINFFVPPLPETSTK